VALIRRSRDRRYPRRALAIAALAAGTTGTVAAAELARVWKRGSAPLPADAENVLEAGRTASMQTLEVALAGFEATPARETALLNLLGSFVVSLGFVRTSTWTIRSRGTFGPFRDLKAGGRHIHHFIPGIAIAFLAGGTAICTRGEELEEWLAIPFGLGVALTLDESALLLELEDVYWSERGQISMEIALGAAALLASTVLTLRLLRRGEQAVLPDTGEDQPTGFFTPAPAGAPPSPSS
jgi:hypothetical protein